MPWADTQLPTAAQPRQVTGQGHPEPTHCPWQGCTWAANPSSAARLLLTWAKLTCEEPGEIPQALVQWHQVKNLIKTI